MKSTRRIIAAVALGLSAFAHAQSPAWPTHPVRVVVPFAAGGAVDIVARMVSKALGENLGQQFVVDNRGGAGGTIGTDLVAKAKPDGHTVLVGSMGVAVNAALYPKLPYDTLKDLAPVTMLGEQPNIIVVHPSLPVHSLKELMAFVKARPRQVTYGSGGVGSNSHLATVLFLMAAKVEMLHVPYKGLGPAIIDLVGGQVQLAVANVSTALPQVKAGKLRLLSVTARKRFPLFPATPTVAEAGLPGAESSGWYGMWLPAGTPAQIVAALNRETTRVLSSAAIKDQFAAQGLEAVPMSPDAFAKEVRSESEKWGKVIRVAGVKPE